MAQKTSKTNNQASNEVKASDLSLMNLNELREIKPADLQKMALDLKVEDTGRMTRQEQIYAILKSQSEKQVEIYAEGVLEILQEGMAFLDLQNIVICLVLMIFMYLNPKLEASF